MAISVGMADVANLLAKLGCNALAEDRLGRNARFFADDNKACIQLCDVLGVPNKRQKAHSQSAHAPEDQQTVGPSNRLRLRIFIIVSRSIF